MTYRELVLDIIKNADLDQEVSVLVRKKNEVFGYAVYMKRVPVEYARLFSEVSGICIDAAEIEKAEPITNF